jgi:hypothetical protein
MLCSVRGLLRQRRRRAAILFAVLLVGVAVAAAHTSVADDHMGEAATVCLAVMAAGGAVVAALPTFGRLLPRPLVSVGEIGLTTSVVLSQTGLYRARGDPSVLQVFRR